MLLGSLGALLVSQPAAAQHNEGYGYAQRSVLAQPDLRGDPQRWDHHGRHDRRDDRGPWISDLHAWQGGRGRTRITARFNDQGSGVDPASLVLRVDGYDVTHHARVDGDHVHFAEFLQPGRHVAELAVRDRAGNSSRRSWAFDVAARGRHDGDDDRR